MGLFDKKYCTICGNKVNLLTNKKLADGNLCSDCARKLSPWFKDRKTSSVQQIREQLAWRKENEQRVQEFHASKVIGDSTRVMMDENAGRFTVVKTADLSKEQPDVLNLKDITGCDTNVEESRREIYYKNAEGKNVSYNPPRYEYDYDFYVVIHVNNPYYSEMRFKLNVLPVEVNNQSFGRSLLSRNSSNARYEQYERMAQEIKDALTKSYGTDTVVAVTQTDAPATSSAVWACSYCGKTGNQGKFCENCGAPAA